MTLAGRVPLWMFWKGCNRYEVRWIGMSSGMTTSKKRSCLGSSRRSISISRAPGEALNILLRILNERKFGDDNSPLLTAIATCNPTKDEYYNEPLDPANLDRFTIQMRTLGLLQRNQWEQAAKVIDLYADNHLSGLLSPKVNRT